MDTDLQWLYTLQNKFNSEIGKTIINPSDWHNEDINLTFPYELLGSMKNIDMNSYREYKFLDTMSLPKEILRNYLVSKFKTKFMDSEISFAHNGTAALSLVIRALSKNGAKRALVVTPCYFSIHDSFSQEDIEVIYYHLSTENNFEINIDSLLRLVNEQYVDLVFITTPTYCTGIEIDTSILKKLVDSMNKLNKWVICDNTLGNMLWDNSCDLFNKDLLNLSKKYDNLIYIDSPSKKLFINGLKHSIIISSAKLASKLEPIADKVMGGITVHQYEFINNIYSLKYDDEIKNSLEKNISLFMENFYLCDAIIKNSNLFFPATTSGFYTVLFFKDTTIENIDYVKFIETILFTNNVLPLPLNHFGFYKKTNFGIRINLSKHPSKLAHSLKSIRDIDIHLFKR